MGLIQANPGILEDHVLSLCAIPRASTDFEGQQVAAEYISRQFQLQGLPVQNQYFMVDGKRTRNVIASIGPISKPRIVIGAHYDTHDQFPGADDNASGVAGLLEIARLLKMNRLNVPCRLDLVAFALEEPPFFGTRDMGSVFHARQLKESAVPVALMVSLEMIGYFSDEPYSQEVPESLVASLHHVVPDKRGNFIAVAARPEDGSLPEKVASLMRRHTDLLVISANVPLFSEMSDNSSYWDCGFPAVMVTDTSMLRNPNYHTADDTPETLDYDRMAAVIDGIMGLIRYGDEIVDKPGWKLGFRSAIRRFLHH